MLTAIVVLGVLCFILLIAAGYLAKELIQRWKINDQFTFQKDERPDLRVWQYAGAQHHGHKAGMRNIVLRSEKRGQFAVKIGFKLGEGLTDYYGYVESDELGEAVFSTYLGKNPKMFLFLVYGNTSVEVSSTELDQQLFPLAIYPPHPWQRPPLHFYG